VKKANPLDREIINTWQGLLSKKSYSVCCHLHSQNPTHGRLGQHSGVPMPFFWSGSYPAEYLGICAKLSLCKESQLLFTFSASAKMRQFAQSPQFLRKNRGLNTAEQLLTQPAAVTLVTENFCRLPVLFIE